MVCFFFSFRRKVTQSTELITVRERQKSLNSWIRIVQYYTFHGEIKQLILHQAVAANSTLANLRPFIDQTGLLRVGGLRNTDLHYGTKQLIFPKQNSFTTMLVTKYTSIIYIQV